MDDLDRLYLELVTRLRRERPARLTEPLTVAQLYEEVIPYRRVRDVVGFRSNDEYETAFTRLIAGERSFILGDSEIQGDLREGLEAVLPDIHRYRSYTETRVWLNPATIPPPGDIRYAPPELREREARTHPPGRASDDEEPERDTTAAEPSSEERPVPPTAGPVPREDEVTNERATGPPDEMGKRVADPPSDEADLEAAGAGNPCPVCHARAPEGASFCPFCGARLASSTCGDCGRRLERSWQFCPDCGARRGPADGAT